VRAPVQILREADVRAVLDMASCIDACERAFVAYSTGDAELPNVIHLDVPESSGEIHVKAGHVHGASLYAVKIASGFAPAAGAPVADGMVIVFDARSGAPAALLLDDGYLTDVRTGAAAGVAARHLAPARVETVAVIGTGTQAHRQLETLAVVRPGFEQVRVWGRNAEHARRCVDRLRADHPTVDVDTSSSVREAVDGADVVITCTAAREPLLLERVAEARGARDGGGLGRVRETGAGPRGAPGGRPHRRGLTRSMRAPRRAATRTGSTGANPRTG
jgi:ornithine cyclodeaminase/alanine dehydrogenase-like protein (mu-crystallin family)